MPCGHVKAPSLRGCRRQATGGVTQIFLHQCLFHQFQLFKALLYSLLLLVHTFHKGGKLVLEGSGGSIIFIFLKLGTVSCA